MAALTTTLLAVSAVAGAVTTADGIRKQRKQSKMAQSAADQQALYNRRGQQAQQKAEDLRRKQMQLDAMRARRSAFRESQVARATALSRGVGAGLGGMTALQSSGQQGAFSQIASQASNTIGAINQNENIGQGIFDANAEQTAAGNMANFFGSEIQRYGNKVDEARSQQALGKSIFESSQTFANVGTSLFGSSNSADITGGWNTYTEKYNA
jgi:hypothetical protein